MRSSYRILFGDWRFAARIRLLILFLTAVVVVVDGHIVSLLSSCCTLYTCNSALLDLRAFSFFSFVTFENSTHCERELRKSSN